MRALDPQTRAMPSAAERWAAPQPRRWRWVRLVIAPVLAFATPIAAAAGGNARSDQPGTVTSQEFDFQWRGSLPPGTILQVKGVIGDVRAVPASGSEARVLATREGGQAAADQVDFEVLESAAGTTICAVYLTATDRTDCAPGREISNRIDRRLPSVDFIVEVPAGSKVLLGTRWGDVVVEGVDADVEAYSVVGNISAATAGHVQAETVTGNIRVALGRTDWSGERTFRTVTGNIFLSLPEQANTSVRALAAIGEIASVFPLSGQDLPIGREYRYPYQAEGVLGGGGRELVLEAVRGSIRLGRATDRGFLAPREAPVRPARRTASEPASGRMSLRAARVLVRNEDPAVRVRAVLALQNHGGAEAVAVLREVVRSDPDALVRQRAAFVLGQLGDPIVVPELLEALTTDVDASVRQVAAYSLGVLGDTRAEQSLLSAVEDSDWRVRQTALWALDELGS